MEVLLEDSQGLPARWCLASKDRWEKVSLQADCEKPKFSLIYILVIFKLTYELTYPLEKAQFFQEFSGKYHFLLF